jgi:hypothetical protein
VNATANVTGSVTRPQPLSPDMEWLASLPHRDSVELDAVETAPRDARRWLAKVLPDWSLPQFETVAALIATELVTNAMVATREVRWTTARPPIRLWLCGGPAVLALLAWDASVLAPVLRGAGEGDESGRGLAIVAALSAEWGFYYPAEFRGKVTWAVIDCP